MGIRMTLAAAGMAVAGAGALAGTAAAAQPGPAPHAGQAARTVTAAQAGQAARTVTAAGYRCPASARGIMPLRPDSVQRAADRALAEAAKDYPGLNTKGAEVMAADRSALAGARGGEVAALCGKRVAARTVVVRMLFPRMLPSASLSQGVVFAGRFRSGYRVWYIAH